MTTDLFGKPISQLILSESLSQEVEGWVRQGWPHVTQTTRDLLNYWFNRDENATEKFYDCQRRAIETIIYCHEVLQSKSLLDLFQQVVPHSLATSQTILDEVKSVEFSKYCLKMATGTGKTWVLIALLVWQYFNHKNGEVPPGAAGSAEDWYSPRFLIVAPGLEVLNRLLDALKGRKDEEGNRLPATADINLPLFVPESWRPNFAIGVLEPDEVRPNSPFPDGPFIFLSNWQQFSLRKDPTSIWEELTGDEVTDTLRGEFLAETLSNFRSLIVMNDEAHHVHIYKGRDNSELVWRKFISVLHSKMKSKHKDSIGVFSQYDFSATPFFGSGNQKTFFPHIVYDYDLPRAMKEMLVKQLWLEEKQSLMFENLDFRAERKKPEAGKRLGEIIGLSNGQKTLLNIGLRKLEQLTKEFRSKGIEKKPVLMILCEETKVADLVQEHLIQERDDSFAPYDEKKVLVLHTELPDSELETARDRLDKIDDNKDSLNVVVSVLMLREGFDRKNISVVVVLRATEADLLLEQIIGRGLRLMFPQDEYPQVWELKTEARRLIEERKAPTNSFDFLFIVEHPRFKEFYQHLREQGYDIGIGDTGSKPSTGDLLPIDAIPARIQEFNLMWPIQSFEQGSFPDLTKIDVSKLPPLTILGSLEDLVNSIGAMTIAEIHFDTGVRGRVWKIEDKYFSYSTFLSEAAKAVAQEGNTTILSGHLSEIASLIDDYVSYYLFGQKADFNDPKRCHVLKYQNIASHIVTEIRKAVLNELGQLHYEDTGVWSRLSDVTRIYLRERTSVQVRKCIYPRQGFSAKGGGFEKRFMEETLELSTDVLAYAKLDRRHSLKIPYRDDYGILRQYEIDFIVRTSDRMFLVETKADKDLTDPTVLLKAKAGDSWCKNASRISQPADSTQPKDWEYLILPESFFKANSQLTFEQLAVFCRLQRDQMIDKFDRERSKRRMLAPDSQPPG